MRKFKKLISVMTCFFITLAGFTLLQHSMVSATPGSFTRLGGSNRYLTSISISKAGWPTGSKYIVIASGENYPDALCAAPLAKLYDAPVLLTLHNSLKSTDANNSLEAEIKRLKPSNAIIIGGASSISDNIINELAALGIPKTSCKRIFGSNRYGTSLEIAKNILQVTHSFTNVAIASGEDFPDALSIASIAAKKKMPILLSYKSSLNSDIKNIITQNNTGATYIIGGPDVINDSAVTGIAGTHRLYGEDRYLTNLEVINEFLGANSTSLNTLYVAAGSTFPDALSGSAAAAMDNAAVLLINNNADIIKDSVSFVHSNLRDISTVKVLGGTGAVSDELVNSLIHVDRMLLGYTYADGTTMTYMQKYTSTISEIATFTYSTDSHGNVSNGSSGGTTYPTPVNTVGYANSVGIKPLALVTNGFDYSIGHSVLSNPSYRQNFVNTVTQIIKKNNFSGINIDFEDVYASDRQNFSTFIEELASALHPLNYLVTVSVPAKDTDNVTSDWNGAYDYAEIGKYADQVAIMTYDLSYYTPGPIAPIYWVQSVVDYAAELIPRDKLLLGIEAYSVDWSEVPSGKYPYTRAGSYSVTSTINLAKKYNAVPVLDDSSKCWHFDYTDSSGVKHHVWYEDGTSVEYKLNLVNDEDLGGAALWQLGLPDTNYMDKIKSVFNK